MQLEGRVALITGGGSGIGKATAQLFVRESCRVAVLDLERQKAEQVVNGIKRDGGQALCLQADISRAADLEEAVRRIVGHWGRLDIVFANAGINGLWAPLEEITPGEWDRTLDTNLKGTFLTVRAAVPELKKHGGAVIITSSVNGTRMFSNTGATAYAVSKAGQVAFAKMAALELAPFNVRVNVICPGAVETNISKNTEMRDLEAVRTPVEYPKGMMPLTHGKSGCPEQVAQLVLFLASDASDLITGTEIWIDGGESILHG
ncbi:MAG: SDR family oxidoreductase [Armatimonadota bacterium]